MTALARNPVAQCIIVVGLALLLALASLAGVAFERTRDALMEQLSRKAAVQAEATARRLDHALSLGIPIHRLVGFDTLFSNLASADRDVFLLALLDADGTPLHAAGTGVSEIANILAAPAEPIATATADQTVRDGRIVTLHPLEADGATAAVLLVYGADAMSGPVRENLIDLTVLLGVVLLLAFEIIALIFSISVILPAQAALRVLASAAAGRFEWLHGEVLRDELGRMIQRLNTAIRTAAATRPGHMPQPVTEPRLIGARLLAFLFVFAEELARPVMVPHFAELARAGESGTGESGTADLAIGWSVAANLLAVAVVMPLASLFYARIGQRRMYLTGALIATAGLLGTGLADSVTALVGWRFLSGCGYALTFVACQGFVLDSTVAANRSSGIAMMVGGIMLADLCGPALGGILSSHIGYGPTFLVSAFIPLLAVCLMPLVMKPTTSSAAAPPRLTWSTLGDTLCNPALLSVLVLVAAPAKLLLTGYLYYLVPIYLLEHGAGVTDIGRVIMVYGLVALLAGPIFAHLGDKAGHHVMLAAAGGLISGIGLMGAIGLSGIPAMVVGAAAVGLGQALSIPAQVALAIHVCRDAIDRHGQGPVMAAMRLVERVVAAAAPIAAGALSLHSGTQFAIIAMGTVSLAGAAAFAILFRSPHHVVPEPA